MPNDKKFLSPAQWRFYLYKQGKYSNIVYYRKIIKSYVEDEDLLWSNEHACQELFHVIENMKKNCSHRDYVMIHKEFGLQGLGYEWD